MNERIEITKCPKCGVTCKVGNDDDFLVLCACCKHSFRPQAGAEEMVTEAKYNEMKKNASKVYTAGAWEAFE